MSTVPDSPTTPTTPTPAAPEKPRRGGARPGAGRKKRGAEGCTERVSFLLTPRADAALRALAAAQGVSRNEAVNRLLEALPAQQ